MSIQSSSVVQKMINRLEIIKDEIDQQPSSKKVKEELSAVKAYCDLLLDTPGKRSPVNSEKKVQQNSEPVQSMSNKRLQEDDEVNGDSIFDF